MGLNTWRISEYLDSIFPPGEYLYFDCLIQYCGFSCNRVVTSRSMIDCHCHLAAAEFDQDLDEVIGRAKQAGVKACIIVTEHYGEFEKTIEICNRYPGFLIPCAGVHPVQYEAKNGQTVARSVNHSDMEGVEEWIGSHHTELVAIGEIGLDHTPRYITDPSDTVIQEEVFAKQIQIAKRYDIPVNVHSRSAGKHVIDCLIRNGATNVVLHAFSGNYKSAMAGITAGYYFSVPPESGMSQQKTLLFEKVPLDQLLLETDSPVLGPVKEERNEPANIGISVQFLSRLHKVDPETVIKKTTENAQKLFPKLVSMMKD